MKDGRPAGDGDSEVTRIGAYRIEAILGQGGMGEVYLARDERLDRHVALKRIRADLPVDEHHRARFRREARAVARLSHPAIVQVFDILETDDGDCIVMERVEGSSLAQAIVRGEIDAALALRLGAEIADGLAEAHGKGLVHRDLKPDNVIVTPSGHAKILDFGLARMLWSEPGPGEGSLEKVSAALTQAGALVGTVHAMSPEQAGGRPVDHRSDLFSLGGLLYEMLTGKAPFRGENLLDSLWRVTSEEPEPLSELRPELSAELVELVERLLAKNPEERPQNARVVADELERLRTAPGDVAITQTQRRDAGAPSVGSRRDAGARSALAELPTGEWPAPASAEDESATETVVRILLLVELCDRIELYKRHGEAPVVAAFARSDRRLRDLVAVHGGVEVEKGETFVGLFERPMDAVSCALAFHRALPECSAGLGSDLQARAAVHLGEVVLRHNPEEDVSRGARPLEVEGLARETVARLLSLAAPCQTLATHGAFDLARRAAGGEESRAGEPRDAEDLDAEDQDGEPRWLAHGRYFVEGVDEPLEVFEVGFDGLAPLAAPADTTAAQRVLSPSEERMLGWRPAVGQSIPRRDHWTLRERVGEGGFGEVWLARHKSGERRVFKFCFEAERLRALKREVTLFRLLKETLGHRDDIARILDWHFEDAPYFVESEYTEGGNLVEWAEEQGGLGEVPLATRLELVAEVAEALGAAHSVGILHKDVKPENVLVTHDREGRPRARLTDFGIGLLTERERLNAPGFTALGFTETVSSTDSGAGTLGYLAPELVEGKAATVQADVYSLGVLLYQMVAGDFSRSLAPGWRRDVADEILAEDVALCTDGRPERRPASALDVAERLRTLDERRRARAEEEARRLAFERSQRRRRLATIVASVASVVLAIVTVMAVRENRARRDAEASRERAAMRQEQAEGLIGFMLGDLRQRLSGVGRLDILESVGTQAMEYFSAVPVEELTAEELSRRSSALYQIGDIRMRQGDLPAAMEAFQESLTLAESLLGRDAENPELKAALGNSHFWVGTVHFQQGNLDDALSEFRAYLYIAKGLVAIDPANDLWQMELAFGHGNVGRVLEEQADLESALAHYEKRLTIIEGVVERNPRRSDWLLELASSNLMVGTVRDELGDLAGAIRSYREDLAIIDRLTTQDPANADWQERLLVSHNYLATALRTSGELSESMDHAKTSATIARGLAVQDENNSRWQFFLASSENTLGDLYRRQGTMETAAAHFERALGIMLRLTARDPTKISWQRELSGARSRLGAVLVAVGDLDEGQSELENACNALNERLASHPGDRDARRKLGECYLGLGEAFSANGHAEQAEAVWDRARETISPLLEDHRSGADLELLGRSLSKLGRNGEARLVLDELRARGHLKPELF